ncbi:P-loop containing nucleoside triphosphate hydrolase protein [Nemania sp. FL0916]|nr:P-loop containing nucleoside triphosphate hydrolase protein [Nemania sp. FL0916]
MASTGNRQEPPARRATVGNPDAQASPPTDIDRRTCRRVVPMRVLGLGVSRTGTASLRQALLDLGYDDTYHYGALLNENPRDAEMWIDALDAKINGRGKEFTKTEWDQLLGHCQAVTDTPCHVFWRELLDAYPDTKVVLSVRDSPEQWAASMQASIMDMFGDKWYSSSISLWRRLLRIFIPVDATTHRFNQLCFQTDFYQAISAGRGKEFYTAQNDAIKAAEGWAPLCDFLGQDIPAWDFPKTNQRDLFRQSFSAYHRYLEGTAQKRLAWVGAALAGLLGIGLGVSQYTR